MRRVLASKRVVGPRFLLGTAMLSLPLFAMTLSIFVVIPRVGKGFLSFRRDGGQKVAGFGDQVELGGFGVIRDDPTVVVRVTPLPAVDERAPRLSLRLRGTSFDHYDGKRWARSPGAVKRLRSRVDDLYVLSRPPRPDHDQQMQIVLEHLDEPVLFVPEGTVALDVPPKVERGERFSRRLHYEAGHDVRYDADGVGLVYKVWVSPSGEDGAIKPLLPESRKAYKQVPKGHERIAELTQTVVGDAQTPADKALRVLRFLNNGTFRYSLEQPLVEGKPPLEVFLFDNKNGHCEYFSSAMAIMLRTQGVATRNVTGFVGGRYNPYGGDYALRQGDAHSWVEVWIKGQGWVTFDPTPPSRAAAGPRTGLWSDVNAFIDALRTRWMTSVVGYDLRTQVGLLRQIGRWLSAHQASMDASEMDGADGGDDLRVWLSRAGRTLGIGIVLLLLGVGLWVLRSRQKTSGRPRSAQHVAAVRLYEELERALTKQGHARPPASTALEHARALSERGFPCSDEVSLVTRSYVEARYGDRVLSAAEISALKAAVGRVAASKRVT
jgi:transglutaminase-like putative cysteine protease